MGMMRGLLGLALTLTLLAGCGSDIMQDASAPAEETSAPAPSPTPSVAPPTLTELPTPSARPSRVKQRKVRQPRIPNLKVPDLTLPPVFDGPVLGGDISWPQCPRGMGIPEKRSLGLPMPLPAAKFVIMGLTNGPGFTPNPCLKAQVDWVKQRHLMAAAYAVSSYPDSETLQKYGDQGPFETGTLRGRLQNVGYQQALFNIGTLRDARLQTPIIWIDVEPVPIFEWSSDKAANAAVIRGAARGYTDNGFQIGGYSTPALWEGVVGDLRFGMPEWRAAGQTSQAEALNRCGPDWSFQGGGGVIGQWVADSRDLNITCPGTEREMFRWFHQY